MKKLLAAVTAILMMSALTACGNDGGTAEVMDETTSAAVQSEAPAETQEETEAETDTETEAESETETEEASDNSDIYAGNGYTVNVDSEKWVDASEYIKMISEYAEENGLSENLTAEEIQGMNDGMFYHTSNDGTNFNIVSNPIGNTDGVKIADAADELKAQYEAMGINWVSHEVVEINGIEWLKIDVTSNMQGTDMKMLQCMALSDGNQYVITYTADTDKYDSAISDFEDVLNSFKLSK